MPRRRSIRAFSLLEVILAVALFAGSVTVILALLPGLTRQATDTADRLTAQRLPDAVRLELARLAGSGLGLLAGKIPILDESSAPGFALVATRNGARVQARDEPPVTGLIAANDQYFLVECWRFTDAPLWYENGGPVLALCVRVSWPYAGPTAPPAANTGDFMFVVSLNQ
jgi:type II secretory pathway pseudopilin PulG